MIPFYYNEMTSYEPDPCQMSTFQYVSYLKETIQRKVIEQGMFVKHCVVEVYPMSFNLKHFTNPKEVIHKGISRADTIGWYN